MPELRIPDSGIKNEPILGYLKGSTERCELEKELKQLSCNPVDVPIVIGDKEFRTDKVKKQVMPHNHKKKIATFYHADAKLIKQAIDVAVETQRKWDKTPISSR